MVTRPAPARVLSASRTGVLDTPSTSARSVSTSACPGLSSPVRIACLIASSTATVRDGSAPAALFRNAGAAPATVVAKAAVLAAAVPKADVREADVRETAVPGAAVLEASRRPEADGKDGM